ncbi:MAG: hypothetical protein EAZ32_05225 [Cytophagia bacterium]|nr:MAG: hypothetical protein EAZ46_03260 [Runella sp.]TAG21599.1 MAG: hypothetical protein EAZ38_07835 [Cytophagales bacterium]TAG40862.1 MAG: hypothetical protein EAZ32_05225 [Cytophagia bacterium]TAG54200.1 MAG: hypothetical protein EAZ29_04815 [Runella slithyformis]TAG82401.1 MAG: hypothetical protein EAZ22_05430 [Cytophagales bacterium]
MKITTYNRMEVLFRLRTARANDKKATIYCRCTVDGARGPEKSLNIHINKCEWNARQQQVASKDTMAAKTINIRLKEIGLSFDNAYLQLYQIGQDVTPQKLIAMVFGQPEKKLLDKAYRLFMSGL